MARIIWSHPALQELDSIADFIALDKPEAARRLVREVVAAIERLRKFPLTGSIPLELRGLPYRQIVIPPCRVFYRPGKSILYIVHIMRVEQFIKRESFPSTGPDAGY